MRDWSESNVMPATLLRAQSGALAKAPTLCIAFCCAEKQMERATGFEPATYGLGSRRSTPELHPRWRHSSLRMRPGSNRVSGTDRPVSEAGGMPESQHERRRAQRARAHRLSEVRATALLAIGLIDGRQAASRRGEAPEFLGGCPTRQDEAASGAGSGKGALGACYESTWQAPQVYGIDGRRSLDLLKMPVGEP